MPSYTVDTPDGKSVPFEAPAGASQAQLRSLAARALKKAHPDSNYSRPVLEERLRKPRQRDELRATPWSLSGAIENKAASALSAFGMDEREAHRLAGRVTSALSDLTPVGAAVEGDLARQAWNEGNYLGAAGHGALAAFSAIPEAGALKAGIVGAVGKKAPSILTHDVARDIIEEAARGGQSFADWRRANEDKIGTMFDYSRLDEVPNVPQVPLERYQPPRGPSDRIISALGNAEVVQSINDVVSRGVSSGAGLPWYNTEPLRQAAEAVGTGPDKYARLMDVVAATSPRSKVTDNIRTASYFNYLRENDLPIPDKLAKGYGSVAQNLHVGNVRGLDARNGWDVFQNPKPASFSSNLQGNQINATIDTHNFRLPGVLSRDPRFLETSINELADSVQAGIETLKRQYPTLPDEVVEAAVRTNDKGKTTITYRPQEWVNKGYISMDDAVKDPGLWTAKPKNNEYGFYEDMQRREAEKMGISPAQYQASMWVGGAEETGLGSLPEPFLKTMEARIRYTADRMGLDPAVVRDNFLKGAAPLLGIGGAAVLLQNGQLVEVPEEGTGPRGI